MEGLNCGESGRGGKASFAASLGIFRGCRSSVHHRLYEKVSIRRARSPHHRFRLKQKTLSKSPSLNTHVRICANIPVLAVSAIISLPCAAAICISCSSFVLCRLHHSHYGVRHLQSCIPETNCEPLRSQCSSCCGTRVLPFPLSSLSLSVSLWNSISLSLCLSLCLSLSLSLSLWPLPFPICALLNCELDR